MALPSHTLQLITLRRLALLLALAPATLPTAAVQPADREMTRLN